MSKQSLFSTAKLRLALFRIWFIKNIFVWIQIAGILCVIFILTGHLTDSTPILGKLLYPLFYDVADEISTAVQEQQISNISDFCAVVLSLSATTAMFLIKAKSLVKEDIKSDKLKIAMIRANLYFNADGKLTKRVEQMTGTDIDGDGLANGQLTKGLFSGMVTATKEFVTIATAEFSEDPDEASEQFKDTVEKAELSDTVEALNEIDKSLQKDIVNKAIDKTEEAIVKVGNSTDIPDDKEKVGWVKSFFTKFKKEVNEEIDKQPDAVTVITSNMEKDAKVSRRHKEKEEKKEEVVQTPEVPVEPPKNTAAVKTKSAADAFIEQLRNRH